MGLMRGLVAFTDSLFLRYFASTKSSALGRYRMRIEKRLRKLITFDSLTPSLMTSLRSPMTFPRPTHSPSDNC